MAIKNTSVALGDPYVQFAKRKVESGEYGSTSEVVREAMRLFMHQDAKLAALQQAVQEGLDSGPPQPFNFDAWLDKEFPEEK